VRPARCAHAASCGGCSFQELDGLVQLVHKLRWVERALAPILSAQGVALADVVGCDDPWGYRNKMDFTFGARRWIEPGEPAGVDASFALGLHVPGRFDKVIDVRSCSIAFPEASAILGSVRELARARGLAPWDVRTHTGLLRHVVLRKGVRTGEILLDLVTSADAPEHVEPLADVLLARHPELTTLVQNVRSALSAVALGERERVLHGPGSIRERCLDLDFAISANSFFQTNTVQAERLFALVRDEAQVGARDVLYDVCCGGGALALAAGRAAGAIWGFELSASAIQDARRNAALNGFERALFVEGDVGDRLAPAERARLALPDPTVAIADPPRAGLPPAALRALIELAPPRLVYVSCNATAAARDLCALLAGGFALRRARPIDLFPHTPHVETVFTLERLGT
jgi:23S rRNA (uracil1939-C5)-methyltransferase